MENPQCRFNHNAKAVVKVKLSAGCVCFPNDREQFLCAHHDYKSEPLGTYEVIEVLTNV